MMGNGVRQFEEENCLVVLYLVQELPGNSIGNPVISEIVLGDGLIVFDNRNHLFFYFFLNRVPNVLLVTQNVDLNVSQIQLLELVATAVDCSEDFICSLVI